MSVHLPDQPEEVIPYVKSKKREYVMMTGDFVANCPSLQVVTWGFRKWSEKWLHIPTKLRTNGGSASVDIIDDIFLSEYSNFDETKVTSYELV